MLLSLFFVPTILLYGLFCISSHDRWNGRALDDDHGKLGSETSRSVNPPGYYRKHGNFRQLIPAKNKGIAAENGSIWCSALDECLAAPPNHLWAFSQKRSFRSISVLSLPAPL
jgi:hypothetical protein